MPIEFEKLPQIVQVFPDSGTTNHGRECLSFAASEIAVAGQPRQPLHPGRCQSSTCLTEACRVFVPASVIPSEGSGVDECDSV